MDSGALKIIAALIILLAAFIGRKKIIEYRDNDFYERREKKIEKVKTSFKNFFGKIIFWLVVIFLGIALGENVDKFLGR